MQRTLWTRCNSKIVLSLRFRGSVSGVARCQGVPKAADDRRWAAACLMREEKKCLKTLHSEHLQSDKQQ